MTRARATTEESDTVRRRAVKALLQAGHSKQAIVEMMRDAMRRHQPGTRASVLAMMLADVARTVDAVVAEAKAKRRPA